MSREIKFRAWHINAKCMCPKVDTHFLNRDYLIFLEYTGLKDKNGKDIYEGDICKYILGKSEWVAEVVFNRAMFTFPIKEKPFGRHRHIGNILERELEVIGNIYENPELLEGEKQ